MLGNIIRARSGPWEEHLKGYNSRGSNDLGDGIHLTDEHTRFDLWQSINQTVNYWFTWISWLKEYRPTLAIVTCALLCNFTCYLVIRPIRYQNLSCYTLVHCAIVPRYRVPVLSICFSLFSLVILLYKTLIN